jgi:hypothetical protein
VHTETAQTVTEMIDRLLYEGWFLATWQAMKDWPDTWALVRDWKTTDPNGIPEDPLHRMQFGSTVVRDVVGFQPDGTAIARRLRLEDRVAQWSTSGSAAEIVATAITLAAPKDCIRADGSSDLRWDSMTTQVLAFFRVRDWRMRRTDGDGGVFLYTRGVGSAELDRPRFFRGQTLEPLGIVPLSCKVCSSLEMQFTGWRVRTGCEAHRGVRETVGFDNPELVATLDIFESAATTADLTELAYCVVYGDCSAHELDWSQEYPAQADSAQPPSSSAARRSAMTTRPEYQMEVP